MITVVIPTLNQNNYTEILLNSIIENTIKPEKIFLINDGGNVKESEGIVKKYKDLNIELLSHLVTMGVNYSWNEGVRSSTTDIISVFNNDIILNKYFFEILIDCYNNYDWGIICPETVSNIKSISNIKNEIILKEMSKREGWCWSVRSSFIKNIPPIPSFLRNYCGDDYIFHQSRLSKKPTLKMINNHIYHYGSGTVGVTKECNGLREKEKILWNNYKENLK